MTHHFASSIVKITKDGDQVISSYLDKGEKLADGTTYAQIGKAPTIESHAAKVDGELRLADSTRSEEPTETLTLNEDGTGTAPGASEGSAASDDEDSDEVPAESDNKTAWFEYAQTKGFEGDIEELTKAQLIEKYGK